LEKCINLKAIYLSIYFWYVPFCFNNSRYELHRLM